INAGAAERFLGHAGAAKKIYKAALAISREGSEERVVVLTNLAYLYALDLNDPRSAVELASKAVAAAGSRRAREAWAHHALGFSLRKSRKLVEARRELETSLAITRSIKDRELEAEVLLTLARVDRDEGRLEAAAARARDAVQLVETMRTGVRFNNTLRA